jgi:hypothetical protein
MAGQNGAFGNTSAERINADRINIAPKGILTGMLAQLKQNAEFRRRFGDRIHRHFFHDGVFTPERVTAMWARRSAELYSPLVPESARWGDFRRDVVTGSGEPSTDFALYTRDNFYPVEQSFLLYEYFPARYLVVLNQFKTANLYPNTVAPDYSVNGTPQHGGTVRPTDEISLTAPAGSIYYTLDGSEFRGGGAGSGGDSVTFAAESAAKKVLVPTTNIGTSWQSDLGFNDAGWTSGTGGVGYERDTGYTSYFSIDVNAAMYNTMASAYIRIPFTVRESSTGYQSLTLRVRYDDGFVAFIDGTKIAQANPPTTLLWNSGAGGGHADNLAIVFEDFNVSAYTNLLPTGNHLLAIQALNYGLTSSDFLLSLELVGQTAPTAPILPNAILYTDPISLTNGTIVKAAAYSSGQWSALCEASFDVITASPDDVIITEILPNANGEDNYKEWFELYNRTDAPIDINGWRISDNGTDSHTIANGGPLLMPAKGYLVLGQTKDTGLNGGVAVDYAYGLGTFTLGNGGDEIILSRGTQVIHAVGYEAFSNAPTPVIDTGMSANPGIGIGMAIDYCNGPVSFWQPQTSVFGTNGDTGTPGDDNDGVAVCAGADTTPPILLDAKFARRDLIFLRFNEPLDISTAENASYYSIDHGVGTAQSASLESANVVIIGISGPLESDVLYTVSVTGVEDTAANPIIPEQRPVSFHTPDVSITEIMYNNRGMDIEWIELQNTTNDPIDISGWYISDDNIYPASTEGIAILPDSTIIPAQGYLVVSLWNDPLFANWQLPAPVLVVNATGTPGALANGGDTIVLYNQSSGGLLIDGSLSAAFPDLSVDGESLEKIDELFPWGDPETVGYNFRKCTTPIGFLTALNETSEYLSDYATPGRANGTSDATKVPLWRLY